MYISGLLTMQCKPNGTIRAWIVGNEITAQHTRSRFREVLLDQRCTHPTIADYISSEALGTYMMCGGRWVEVLNEGWLIKSFVDIEQERDLLIEAAGLVEIKYDEDLMVNRSGRIWERLGQLHR